MPNNIVFNYSLDPLNTSIYGQKSNGNWQTIRSNDNYALVNTDQQEMYARQGLYYGITTGAQTVAANGYLVVQVSNATGSGKSLHFSRIAGGASVNTTMELLRNGSFSAAGTPITPRNRNFGFSDNSAATAKWITQATDPTTGGTLMSSFVQTGGQVEVSYGGTWIMPPNSTFAIRLVNNTNQNNLLSSGLSWWEESV